MRVFEYPERSEWPGLSARPVMKSDDIVPAVTAVIDAVREKGDAAVIDFTARFDKVSLRGIKKDIRSDIQIPLDLKRAIDTARANIEEFHRSQIEQIKKVETMPGVSCWRKSVAIESVGLYIPGGSAPLFSTLLMLAIPAQIAGCREIVVCTPPTNSGEIHPTIEYTASILGIKSIYLAGGAQAIAAMAYGTETVPKVFKIFGPGNQYVTAAKQLVQQHTVAIDMPAGPSEVLVIADQESNPEFIAADLLSQAEHGPDSQVILVSDTRDIIERTIQEVATQIEQLPRKEAAAKAMLNSRAIVVRDLADAVAFSNVYAPEHLIINCSQASELAEHIINAGSVFLGPWSCESLGDYASGTNHTLPTNGFALNYSGVSLDSFVKKITFQHISENGIKELGPSVEVMAEAEQLRAHRNAVTVRLKSMS